MRYLSIFLGNIFFSLVGFTQNPQTVTLVFVSSPDNNYKNFEAVIDEVSYYPENTSAGSSKSRTEFMPPANRNTIWLTNFQTGKHTLEIYNLKKGSSYVRAGNSPVYDYTFIVKKGFDTKIAVKSNGQVQFSERLSAGNNSSIGPGENNNVYTPVANNKIAGRESGKKIKHNENQGSKAVNNSTAADENNNENRSANGRHTRKRIDTAIVMNESDNNDINAVKNSNGKLNSDDNISNHEPDDQKDVAGKAPMDDNSFNQLYETLRNQWHPGQRMKTLTNEFLNSGDNFTTSQARQLIKLLTEEGNRLILAKSCYHCITDPENFSEMDDILRYKTSRDQLHNFVKDAQD